MTNERELPHNVDATDELVASTYRELADERAPDHLNKAILRQAARAARPAYARSILWMKPVAWTATVAICFAIVLQVTQLPEPDGVPISLPATTVMPDPAAMDKRAETSPPEPPASGFTQGRSEKRASEVPAKAGPEQSAASPASIEAEADDTTAARQRVSEQDAVPEESLPSGAAEFELQDADMLRRAEDLARLQSGNDREPGQAAATAFASRALSANEPVQHCDDETRATPESWYACITSLEEAGLGEAARQQREQLAAAFPDFDMP